MYSPIIGEDLIPKLYKLGKATNKPMTEVVDTILRDYLSEVDLHESDTDGESYDCDGPLELVEREVKIQKRQDGKYSVAVFDPIKDDSLSCYLNRNYELWDFKIFETKKEAEDYASLQKKPG